MTPTMTRAMAMTMTKTRSTNTEEATTRTTRWVNDDKCLQSGYCHTTEATGCNSWQCQAAAERMEMEQSKHDFGFSEGLFLGWPTVVVVVWVGFLDWVVVGFLFLLRESEFAGRSLGCLTAFFSLILGLVVGISL